MKALGSDNLPFDLNQVSYDIHDKLNFCVLDCSLEENIDFYFKNFIVYQEFEYPAAELKIGKYTIEVPLNWRILTSDPTCGDLELIDVDELVNFDYNVLVLNPYKSYTPNYFPVKINNAYNTNIKWFVPKLQRKNILAIPLGIDKEWPDFHNGLKGEDIRKKFPECIFMSDDTETMKDIINLHDFF